VLSYVKVRLLTGVQYGLLVLTLVGQDAIPANVETNAAATVYVACFSSSYAVLAKYTSLLPCLDGLCEFMPAAFAMADPGIHDCRAYSVIIHLPYSAFTEG
jgi:hypothetical protein